MVNEHGVTLSPGTRRFTCPTNATYRRLSLTIATEMAKRFARTPGVIGWQIDNELTLGESGRCYCHYCREGFEQWLRKKYGSLDALNQAWGTVFWSNTYTDFAQIPVPLPSGAPPNPGHALDYDRYQSYANVSFLKRATGDAAQGVPHPFHHHEQCRAGRYDRSARPVPEPGLRRVGQLSGIHRDVSQRFRARGQQAMWRQRMSSATMSRAA